MEETLEKIITKNNLSEVVIKVKERKIWDCCECEVIIMDRKEKKKLESRFIWFISFVGSSWRGQKLVEIERKRRK